MNVPILHLGGCLIATLQDDMEDGAWRVLRESILATAERLRATAAILDVTGLEIIDSYAARVISDLGQVLRLRGVESAVVGIQPEVAFAMVELGMGLPDMRTALDLQAGLRVLGFRVVRVARDG